MICNQCGNENRGYYNYCSNDGKRLKSINKRYVLNPIGSESCISCNSNISKYSNYCNECGSIQTKANQKKSIRDCNEDKNKIKNRINTNINNIDKNFNKIKNFAEDISTSTIKKNAMSIDIKQSILTVLLMLGCMSLVAIIFSTIFMNELEALGIFITDEISQWKLALLSMVSYNIPRLFIDIRLSMMSVLNFTTSISGLVGPSIIITSAIISACMLTKKEKVKSNLELNAIAVAGLYSIMIFILSFISNTNILLGEGATLTIKVSNFIGLIISSFAISFIGTYIGMYIKSKDYRTIYSRIFISASSIILLCLFITTVITYTILYSNNTSTTIGYMFTEIIPQNSIIKFAIVVVIAPWLFISSNFSSINFMNIDKYSTLDLVDLISPAVILIVVLPIICLFIKGRRIKCDYKEENSLKVIFIFSCMYSLIIGVIAYATTSYMSFGSNFEGGYVSDIIYEISYMFEYIEPSFMENYITPIYNALGSGMSMGVSMIGAIIGSFIFSFIFIFIGYKTKYKKVKEGRV